MGENPKLTVEVSVKDIPEVLDLLGQARALAATFQSQALDKEDERAALAGRLATAEGEITRLSRFLALAITQLGGSLTITGHLLECPFTLTEDLLVRPNSAKFTATVGGVLPVLPRVGCQDHKDAEIMALKNLVRAKDERWERHVDDRVANAQRLQAEAESRAEFWKRRCRISLKSLD